jgi:hypothetical protein
MVVEFLLVAMFTEDEPAALVPSTVAMMLVTPDWFSDMEGSVMSNEFKGPCSLVATACMGFQSASAILGYCMVAVNLVPADDTLILLPDCDTVWLVVEFALKFTVLKPMVEGQVPMYAIMLVLSFLVLLILD